MALGVLWLAMVVGETSDRPTGDGSATTGA